MNTDEYGQMRELEDHYWWFVSRRELALNLLKIHNKQSIPKILDVGCGTGAMLTALNEFGLSVGIDLSPDALNFSANRGLDPLILANAEQIPFRDNSFDVVISLDTIEHVPQDGEAISEIYRVLKPGGLFIMNVPAFMWLWGPHDEALMHQRRYVKKSVQQLLISRGFSIEKLSYSVFLLFPAVVVRRLLERLGSGEAKVKLPQFGSTINQLLIVLMRFESQLFRHMNLPWGSSLVCVAQKPIS